MSRRVGQPSVVFGPSTVFIDFPRSDGDQSKWPTNTTYIVDGEGQVNFMEQLDIEESGQVRKWRAAVGKAIATKLEMQGDSNNYVLRSWPAGYQMYDHHKGPAGNPRHDLYLYGYRSGRFRSINEFIPHAIWLFSDETMNYANCECKYCTKQPQKGITASMGDILGTPLSVSPTPRVRREKPREKRVSRPYASVQKVLQPALRPSSHIQDSPTLAERNSDLRAVFSRNSMKLRRWYRDGEIVWCQLSTPISSPLGDDSNIVFWPGLVQECRLKAVPVPRDVLPADSTSKPSNTTPGSSSTGLSAHEEGRGIVYEKTERPPFTVEQSTIYTVELFAVNKSIRVFDREVIPYQAYVPPEEVIGAMQAIDPERLDFDRDSVLNFNPCTGAQPPLFEDAAGPYAVALQIASNVSQFFSVTDEWEFTYSVSAPSATPSRFQKQPEDSLAAVINASARMNTPASVSAANSQPPYLYRNLSGTQPDMSQLALDKLAENMLGPRPGPAELTRTQIRFQGLWWGPERIWVDDFVRLKVPRRCLAPYGSQDISPPAGPSKQAIEHYKSTGRDNSEIGAGSRGVFMRIEALFVVELTSEGKKKKECRASGPLFELVDEDWDEDNDSNIKQHKLRTQSITETARPIKPLPTRAPSSSVTQPLSVHLPSPSTPAPAPAPSVPQSQPTIAASASSSSIPSKTIAPTILSFDYLPPQPPLGYRFRPILTPGHEAVISLSLLSGRYYPGLLMHPLIVAEMNRAARVPIEEGGILKYGHIWALDGLNGGFHCSVDPGKFKSSRPKMLDHSDKEAYGLLKAFKQTALAKLDGEDSDEGKEEDVDMLVKDEDRISDRGYAMDRDGDVTMS